MEKILNRSKYFRDFIEFRDLVQLKPELLSALENHHYFADEMKNVVQHLETDNEKKLFILVWFTHSRSVCEQLIRLLSESGQREAADKLTEYNTSKGRINEFRITADIPYNECISPKKGSLYYDMIHSPRGTAIIINNVKDEVFMESKRFEFIFEKLHFEVQLWNDLTKDEIKQQLTIFAANVETSDAFILMVISHGLDETILGTDACKAYEKLALDSNDLGAQKVCQDDVIEIMQIVDIFSNTNCKKLLYKPKLFFFNCCRIKTSEQIDDESSNDRKNLAKVFKDEPIHENRSYDKLKSIDPKWARDNQDSYICYACAECYQSFYGENGLTHFGQALSHSIAQYSCEETLNSIMSRTCDLLQHFSDESGNFAPEIRGKGLRREICFNP